MNQARQVRGFTLIELLVVIAIIALLIGLLLPSLAGARAEGRATQCSANARSVAVAVNLYTVDNRYFPPSYVYASDQTGFDWRPQDQLLNNPTPANGYIHWSGSLFYADGGNGLPEKAFMCPAVPRGGAPATSPGSDPDDWEPGQLNDNGAPASQAIPHDRQAKRMAYTGNAAIFPRNKLYGSNGERLNQLVNPAWVDGSTYGPSKTILATEFLASEGWKSLMTPEMKIKSHRPITPFIGLSAGSNVYAEPNIGSVPRFAYPSENLIYTKAQLADDMIEDSNTTLNAVGRHHPGGDSTYGGTANFSFVDGHVSRMTVLESIRKRYWGDRFYSITGKNGVVPPAH